MGRQGLKPPRTFKFRLLILIMPKQKSGEIWDCIIIGGGPAGYSAAVYAGRASMKTLVLAGYRAGGQLMMAPRVEDYLGFPNGIPGSALVEVFRKHAEMYATKIMDIDVTEVDLSKRPFRLKTDEGEFLGKTIIIATGANARWLGLPSEKAYIGKGVSACALCDSWFFKGKDVAVIGGGDTALREALYLAATCKSVTVIHRRDQLRAMPLLEERAKVAKIRFVWNSTVEEFLGDGAKLSGLKLKDVKTGKTSELKVDGVFVAIGHAPGTEFLKGKLELDAKGFIVLKNGTMGSVPGVFAAGDVADWQYMQAITSAGQGCAAALDAHRLLEEEK
jgi:thioredoxin reductase (NADPH)